jgi:hypothetical protein
MKQGRFKNGRTKNYCEEQADSEEGGGQANEMTYFPFDDDRQKGWRIGDISGQSTLQQ